MYFLKKKRLFRLLAVAFVQKHRCIYELHRRRQWLTKNIGIRIGMASHGKMKKKPLKIDKNKKTLIFAGLQHRVLKRTWVGK